MHCPVDQTKLEAQARSVGDSYLCPKCQGLFASRGYVEQKLRDALAPNPLALDGADSAAPPGRPMPQCPSCAPLLMQCRVLDKQEIPVCPVCSSAWFEQGKLEELIKRQSRTVTGADRLAHEGTGLGKFLHDLFSCL